jgi:MFS family permease
MMTGIVAAGSGAGLLIMPPFLNWLITICGWRATFSIMGGILLIVIVTAQFLKRDPAKMGQVAYGENNAGEEGSISRTKGFSLKEAMLTRQFWLFCAVLFCFGFGFFSIQLHIVPYVTDLGISATIAAVIMAAIGGATIIGEVGLGSTGDKIGYKRAFLIGAILMALALFVLMLARELWAFYLLAILSGLAFGNSATQESPIAAWLFGLKSHGQILGFFAFSYTVGGAVGPVITGYIFDRTGNYQLAFLLSVGLSMVAIILTVFLKPPIAKTAQKTGISKAISM